MILLIDNYDSFVHNLARYVQELGGEALVRRNDETTVEDVAALLGRDVHDVAQLLAMAETPKSLDAAVDRTDEEHTLGARIQDWRLFELCGSI